MQAYRPKVLYAIQGTGNGHVSRARSLFPILQEHFEIDFALVGGNSEVELPVSPVWVGKGITMEYSKKGRISIWNTWRVNSVRTFLKEIQEIPVDQYDFVINDFESVSSRASKRKNVPIFGLSHQAGVAALHAPKTKAFLPIGKWIMNQYAPVKQGLGFHFDRFDENVLPPVVREDVLQAHYKPGNRIVVYLPAYGLAKLEKFLNRLPYSFTVFHKKVKTTHETGNIRWETVQAEKFSKELLRSKGVICSAGFELPSECLHLGIPLMVIPIKGQYEQYCNAAALEKLGVSVQYGLNQTKMLIGLFELFDSMPVQVKMNDIRPEVATSILNWWMRMRK